MVQHIIILQHIVINIIGGRNGDEASAGSWTTGIHTLIFNGENNAVILDETTLGSGTNILSATNLWIGRRGNSTNLQATIYYVKITDKSTGNLVRYMVPVVQKSTGTAGMYDIVNDLFYINSGTGTITVPE